jgi:hypothetical protein
MSAIIVAQNRVARRRGVRLFASSFYSGTLGLRPSTSVSGPRRAEVAERIWVTGLLAGAAVSAAIICALCGFELRQPIELRENLQLHQNSPSLIFPSHPTATRLIGA